MQQSAESAASPTTNFAGLLATLASTAHRPGVDTDGSLSQKWKKPGVTGDKFSSQGWKSDWNDDDAGEDVATLSYERALRTHSRYRAADLSDDSLTEPSTPSPRPLNTYESYELAPVEMGSSKGVPGASPASRRLKADGEVKSNQDSRGAEAVKTTLGPSTLFERNLKNASITIRMSKEECAQLHERAAEAGLTISAYLRSCTFEAETLRALVKDTMAQLKSATAAEIPASRTKPRSGWMGRVKRLFRPWQRSPRAVQA